VIWRTRYGMSQNACHIQSLHIYNVHSTAQQPLT